MGVSDRIRGGARRMGGHVGDGVRGRLRSRKGEGMGLKNYKGQRGP